MTLCARVRSLCGVSDRATPAVVTCALAQRKFASAPSSQQYWRCKEHSWRCIVCAVSATCCCSAGLAGLSVTHPYAMRGQQGPAAAHGSQPLALLLSWYPCLTAASQLVKPTCCCDLLPASEPVGSLPCAVATGFMQAMPAADGTAASLNSISRPECWPAGPRHPAECNSSHALNPRLPIPSTPTGSQHSATTAPRLLPTHPGTCAPVNVPPTAAPSNLYPLPPCPAGLSWRCAWLLPAVRWTSWPWTWRCCRSTATRTAS